MLKGWLTRLALSVGGGSIGAVLVALVESYASTGPRAPWSAVVMADVGPNAIVGAGAVVTEPIPASVVAAGVPARVIRQRA